jgi:hypothetical protein
MRCPPVHQSLSTFRPWLPRRNLAMLKTWSLECEWTSTNPTWPYYPGQVRKTTYCKLLLACAWSLYPVDHQALFIPHPPPTGFPSHHRLLCVDAMILSKLHAHLCTLQRQSKLGKPAVTVRKHVNYSQNWQSNTTQQRVLRWKHTNPEHQASTQPVWL